MIPLYTYVPDMKLRSVATKSDHDIFFPLAISKHANQAVTSFSVRLSYTTLLFQNVVSFDVVLESSKTTIATSVDGVKTVYTV